MGRAKISAKWLESQGACANQVAVVRREIGMREVLLTRRHLMRAAELHLNLNWLAGRILSTPAWAEYEKAKAPALAEYEKAMAQALAEYEKAKAQALAEYEKAKAPALAEYGKTKAQALAEALGLN